MPAQRPFACLTHKSRRCCSLAIACAVVTVPPACAIDGQGAFQLVTVSTSLGMCVAIFTGLDFRNGAALSAVIDSPSGSGGAVDVARDAAVVFPFDEFNNNTASVRIIVLRQGQGNDVARLIFD